MQPLQGSVRATSITALVIDISTVTALIRLAHWPGVSLDVIAAALGLGVETGGIVAVSSVGVFAANWIGFPFAAGSMPAIPAGYHRNLQRGVMGEVIRTAMPVVAMTKGELWSTRVADSPCLIPRHCNTSRSTPPCGRFANPCFRSS